jgi:flagellar transcriptional activator FlhC
MHACACCQGQFLVSSYDLNQDYHCNLCHIPSRAGKTKKAKALAELQSIAQQQNEQALAQIA